MPVMSCEAVLARYGSTEQEDAIHIDPETIVWMPDPFSELNHGVPSHHCLTAALQIGPVRLFLEAYEILLYIPDANSATGERRVPFTAEMALQARVDTHYERASLLWAAHQLEGLCQTLEIEGRHYAIFACPAEC